VNSVNIYKLQTTLLIEDLILKYCHNKLDHSRKVYISVCEWCMQECKYH
jgi:hypothetical protein